MIMRSTRRWLPVFLAILGIATLGLRAEARTAGPAPLVLTAFGTTTTAFDTYRHLEAQVRERFPGHEIRWAFTSGMVRKKVQQEQHQELKSLPEVLADLKAEGFTEAAIQSFLLAPGKEWQEVLRQSRMVPQLTVAVGQPLLSGKADELKVVNALAQEFPADLQKNAVVLVGHGSRDPRAQETNASLAQALRSRYPEGKVFFGLVEFQKPGIREVLQEVKKSGATNVVLVPFLLVAGEHVSTDILGDGPGSWKSRFLAQGISRVDGVRQGLGYNDGITQVFLDHLQEALRSLQD